MKKLKDKVAIITGAAGGIGIATAKLFLDEGARVALVDLSEEDLKETVQSLDVPAENILSVPADVSKEEDVKNYIQQTIDHFGQVDILFNNAGITGIQTDLTDIKLEDFEKVMAINTTGVFLGMKHVLPLMMEQKSGSVINTSSVDGLRGSPQLAPYAASKHAVVGLTKTAALEVAEAGVRVNSIHPSPVDTSMMDVLEANTGEAESAKAEYTSSIPLGKYVEAEDIANLALFLASDDSAFISGSQYRIDGAMGAQQ
ncbi:SDR family oxidoreductase [Aerococcaceae bacterium DSM 111020]|nr:SDR family oxidoreductase [Aerococcaceae bacterium DSM 111020]